MLSDIFIAKYEVLCFLFDTVKYDSVLLLSFKETASMDSQVFPKLA